jgi:hypothetical protein
MNIIKTTTTATLNFYTFIKILLNFNIWNFYKYTFILI